ncbi:MAG TPA: AAA family ATPase [Jatrophihabitantaceae bacterium]
MSRLVGRDAPLGELLDALRQAQHGRGAAVVVQGEAGMGKTRLAEAVADAARANGLEALWGWCSAGDTPPYWMWRPVLTELDPTSVLLSGASAEDRDRVFVDLLAVLDRATAVQPALIVLDDVHWADEPSLRLLQLVVEACPRLALLVVITVRDDPVEGSTPGRVYTAKLPSAVARVSLGGLPIEAIREVAADVLGEAAPAGLADELARRTGGNPFFVREVVRLARDRGPGAITVPPGVRELLERRLARLDQPAHDLLGVLAVAGEDGTVPFLAAITSRPDGEVLDLVDEAVRLRLVEQPGPGAVRFVHALVGEVRYAELAASRRGALHRAVAEHLETTTRDPDAVAARIAQHWRSATGSDAEQRARSWTVRAARAAMRALGYEQAAALYRQVHDPDPALLLECGDAELRAGALTTARETFSRAVDSARAAGDVERFARAVLGLGSGVSGFEVQIFDAGQVRLLHEALAALGEADSGLHAAVLARLSVASTGLAGIDERVEWAQQAMEMAGRIGDAHVQVAVLAAYCDAIAGPDFVDERRRSADRMLALGEQADDLVAQLLARRFRLVALLERGDVGAADAEIAAFTATADRLRSPLYSWYVPLWRGMRARMIGDDDAADHYLAETYRTAESTGSLNAALLADSQRMTSALLRGDRTLPPIDLSSYPPLESAGQWTVTIWLVRAMSEPDDAAVGTILRQHVGPRLGELPRDAEWLNTVVFAGWLALRVENHEVAATVLRLIEPYCDVWAIDGIGAACAGLTAYHAGRLAVLLGRYDDAERWLADAVRAHEGAGAIPLVELARAAQDELATARGTPRPARPAPADEGVLTRQGRLWRLDWRGASALVPDSKGMADLATLLGAPGREVHVLDLVGAPQQGDTGPVLDAAARTSYQARLRELQDELDAAEADADAGRLARAREEWEWLTAELSSALGLGGRDRRTGDPVERARKAVGMRVATAIRAIAEVHEPLARHLRRAVRTGRFCSYQPEEPTAWRVARGGATKDVAPPG